MPDYYVYLKTGNFSNNSSGSISQANTIPLRATSVSISTQRQVPSVEIPLSGLVTGESTTAALDLGMAKKNISVQGFIVSGDIQRHDHNGNLISVKMTAQEIAQLIHSSVDSSALAKNQNINELVILIPSFVNENYVDRGKAADASVTQNGTVSANIPWTFRARGSKDENDNIGVPFPNSFPTSENSTGLGGFVRSFSTPLEAETVEVSFQLEFEVAFIAP
jgi:hypothetical protein